ncbi:alpha/beta fold hydrolase [Pseudoduganella umbonata]|uniref:Alpha/beta fold hydrolase n=1 Tax=Pseudoduganella umbonata TaxID=864828 RepID=A0A4P8HPY8_9BURK|nr:alpha/beta fold hydrolase [Pseudoduganella umbonata]MBB3221219.1 pimeloyl-ACP methyl ester carboxylesterase [Pseudoduganella umbonata]QCP10405.1 alpha/beta fold hydrolase [Pseudoduganella umbonata]
MNDPNYPALATTHPTYRYATIGGRKLAYLESGRGFPVLLGHSYLWDAAMWQPQIDVLSRHFRVIVPDLWGHGQSDPPPDGTRDLDDLAEHHAALLDSLAIDACHVVGLSAGGMWAEALAQRHPGKVRKLVLMDTFVGEEPEASRSVYMGMLARIEREGEVAPELLDRIVPMFFGPAIDRQSALFRNFSSALCGFSTERLRDGIVPLGRIVFGRKDRLARLHRLDPRRTLVVAGQCDIPRPVAESIAMANLIDCPMTTVPDAGHIANLENPGAVNRILLKFLLDGDGQAVR